MGQSRVDERDRAGLPLGAPDSPTNICRMDSQASNARYTTPRAGYWSVTPLHLLGASLLLLLLWGYAEFSYTVCKLEAPRGGLLVRRISDPASLANFRRFTVPNIITPALELTTTLEKPNNPPEVHKNLQSRLSELKAIATLRVIPESEFQEYQRVLVGLSYLELSLTHLQQQRYGTSRAYLANARAEFARAEQSLRERRG